MNKTTISINLPLSEQLALQPPQRPGVWSVINMTILLCRIARSTQRLNVVNVATAAFDNGLDVIGGKFYVRPLATQTFVAVVVAKSLPFCGGVRAARLSLPGAITVGNCRVLFGIFLSPLTAMLYAFVWVCPLPPTDCRDHFIWVGLRPLAVTITLALSAISVFVPIACGTLLTRFAVICCHKKSPFALVAKEALGYTLFATSAYYTCRHSPETLARLPGFSRSFNPVIIPNSSELYQRWEP